MQVSDQIIRSLFNHLTRSYSADEACEIMIQKYPYAEGDIRILMQHGYTPNQEEIVMEQVNNVETVVEAPATDLKAAVKQKTAKAKPAKVAKPAKAAPKVKAKAPKAPKAAKPAGASKMDRARELYTTASDKSRKAMIDMFGRELGLGKAAASTYFYAVKS